MSLKPCHKYKNSNKDNTFKAQNNNNDFAHLLKKKRKQGIKPLTNPMKKPDLEHYDLTHIIKKNLFIVLK